MNGSPSVKVALFIRNGGSDSRADGFYVTEIYTETWRKYENGLVDIFGSEKEVKEIVDAVETEVFAKNIRV